MFISEPSDKIKILTGYRSLSLVTGSLRVYGCMVNYFRCCLPLVRGRWLCTTTRPTACPGWWWGGWAGRRRGSTPAAPPASPPGTYSYTSSSTNRNTMESLLCNFRREKLRRHNISLGKEPFFSVKTHEWYLPTEAAVYTKMENIFWIFCLKFKQHILKCTRSTFYFLRFYQQCLWRLFFTK